jgi:hypothetical protein
MQSTGYYSPISIFSSENLRGFLVRTVLETTTAQWFVWKNYIDCWVER